LLLLHILSPLPRDLPNTLPLFLFAAGLFYIICFPRTIRVKCLVIL
jgi:hypothetical protein